MSPHKRGIVPEPQLSALLTARTATGDAETAYQVAVANALKAGGSVREVHDITGLSTSTIQRWGRAHGWPTDKQRKGWAEEQAPRDEWDAKMNAARGIEETYKDL